MKQLLTAIAFSSISAVSYGQTQPPPERTFNFRLPESYVIALRNLIADAKLDGETRRNLDKVLMDQVTPQLQPPAKDSGTVKQPVLQPKDKPKNK